MTEIFCPTPTLIFQSGFKIKSQSRLLTKKNRRLHINITSSSIMSTSPPFLPPPPPLSSSSPPLSSTSTTSSPQSSSSGGAFLDVNGYYLILEVGHDASQEEMKRSYRRLLLKFHPDKNIQGDPQNSAQKVSFVSSFRIFSRFSRFFFLIFGCHIFPPSPLLSPCYRSC